MDFCHLHVHSDYSLLDGAAKVRDLVRACGERGLSSIALTDHGNMCGAIAFYKEARKAGIKPLVGCETYMAPGPRTDRRRDPTTGVSSFHLTLLARDYTGYRNLVELCSTASLDGFYYNPRIDKDVLAAKSAGLLVLSGCFKGETSYLLRTGRRDLAYRTAAWYRDLFGENYLIEIQRNGTEGQDENNADLLRLARDLGIGVVCTNDVHYLNSDDALAQEIRMAISTSKTVTDDRRLKHRSSDFWLRPATEMWELFRDVPEACQATLDIASRCNLELPFGEFHLPQFSPPDGLSPEVYFERLCRRGLEERYGAPPPAAAQQRLEYEMDVIRKMGFVSYFLITWDFIRYARERSIPVGPGRGSAAGSIVAYVLRITDVCPLRYELLFERFLNSERISMPDIDIDFCRDGRAEVIRYVTEKYGGAECVSQIITFGTLAARAVVRDVGRALDVPLAEIDALAKKIPNGPGATLAGALEADPELRGLAEDARYKELFEVSRRLEGMNRHPSTHAAGVVVGDGPLQRYVPLYRVGEDVVTQYTMEYLEDIGLLKMDFLGLKTLTVIDKALGLLERTTGTRPDLAALAFDDPRTWDLLQRGEAVGVFQLESGGMRDLLQRLRPDRLEDLIAVLALYRPGPMQTGMVDLFVRRKHGEEPISYLHPELEPLLRDTYGTFVFQEQIMLIAHRFAGFTMNAADGLRKAMGKKKLDVMLKYKQQFVEGCVARGAERALGEQIWDVMEQFAKYAFNKSHTTAYAVVSYHTAWLKANHPVEFMAALMTCDMGNTDKIVAYIDECRRMSIPVLAPDVNVSLADFDVQRNDAGVPSIRFGLAAVKGVGHGAADAIVAARVRRARPFDSLADLTEAVDHHLLGRTVLEALVKAGALDPLGGHRAQLLAALDGALRAAAAIQEDRRAGQMSLFGAAAPAEAVAPDVAGALPDAPRWNEKEVLLHEKEALGIYMSSHPLAKHEPVLRALSTHGVSGLTAAGSGARVLVGGMVSAVKTMFPKTGRNRTRKMARFRIEDFDGAAGCVMFADGFERDGELLVAEAIGFVEATVDLSREEPDLKVDRFVPVERALDELADRLVIEARAGEEERTVAVLRALLERFPGKHRVQLRASPAPGIRAVYQLERGIAAGRAAHDAAVQALGPDAVRWTPRRLSAPERRGAPVAS